MNDRAICEVCSRSSPSGPSTCVHCGTSFTFDPRSTADQRDNPGPRASDFGFQPANRAADIFLKAEAVFLSSFASQSTATELGYLPETVLENNDAYYFPVGWIGCSGHLVTKVPMRLISFGSYIGAEAHLWAYRKGISLERLGKDRRNTLAILSVEDVQNTIRVLKTFLNPSWVETEFSLDQSNRPAVIEDVDLYFGIRALLEAEANDWFKFEVR